MPFGEARTLGFNNQPLAKLLVANSIINKQGMFFYSGTPAFGNLIASVGIATGGTDRFGNVYEPGNTTYGLVSGDTYAAAVMASINSIVGNISGLTFTDVTHSPFIAPSFGGFANPTFGAECVMSSGIGTVGGQQSGIIAQDSAKSGITGGLVGAAAGAFTIQGGNLVATVGSVLESWHNAVLATGFTAGGTTPRFRQEPIGITQPTMVLDGAVNLTATEAANTTMFTLPVSPLNAHDYTTKSTLSGLNPGAGVMPATVHVDTGGHVQIAVNGVSGNFVVLDGIRIPLD